MKKSELVALARIPGSERGPLGAWASARLALRPNAGDITCIDRNWYIAVAGVRREGYKGNIGGLYARWVQVPEEECRDWEEEEEE